MEKGGEDLDEQFVYSVFNYYDTYAYIHYGPIKIWKSRHLIDKEVKECHLCNRKFFNAGTSAIALIHWKNKDKIYNELKFTTDIDNNLFSVKKVNTTISTLYEDDGEKNGVCVIEARNYSFASPRLTGSINDGDEYGNKWVNEQNLLKVLPLFCVCRDQYAESGKFNDGDESNYCVIDTVYKSADGGTKYQKDNNFLQDCLLYSICTHFNHCKTDSKFFKIANKKLDKKILNTTLKKRIYELYNGLVKDTQINGLKNIETFHKKELGKLWAEHNLFPRVRELKRLLRDFYNKDIRPKMVKYELLK